MTGTVIPLPPERSSDPEIASLISQMRDHHETCVHCVSHDHHYGRARDWRQFVLDCHWGGSLANAYVRTVTRGEGWDGHGMARRNR